MRHSAAADRDDDFQPVSVTQHLLLEPAARDDFAVAFKRDALAAQLHFPDEGRYADGLLELAQSAVNQN